MQTELPEATKQKIAKFRDLLTVKTAKKNLIDDAESPPFFREARYSLIKGCVTSRGTLICRAVEHHPANSISERRVES